MTGKAEIQNKQVVGLHNTTEPMNAYFVIITEPLSGFMGLKEKVVLSSTIILSFTCQWEYQSRSQLCPRGFRKNLRERECLVPGSRPEGKEEPSWEQLC